MTPTATADGMRIRALAPWFGAKRMLAPKIIEELGPHRQYFEPFCGSMAVLLVKEPSQKETVNDLHGDLINLARVVADPQWAPRLHSRLQATLFSEAMLEEAQDMLRAGDAQPIGKPTPEMAERAYWYFLACWLGRSGAAGTRRLDYQIAVRWTKNGGSATTRFQNAVESMPAWHRRLRNVVILRRDGLKVIDRFEDVEGTAVYIDPPYVMTTRSAPRADRADKRYLYEFLHETTLFNRSDHEVLRDVLATYRRARVVVSYYDCPEVRELYKGWTFIEHPMVKNLARASARGVELPPAPEVLIINGPSYAREG